MPTSISCFKCSQSYSAASIEFSRNSETMVTRVSLQCKKGNKNKKGCGHHPRFVVSKVNHGILEALHDRFAESRRGKWSFCKNLSCGDKSGCFRETIRTIAETQAMIKGCAVHY